MALGSFREPEQIGDIYIWKRERERELKELAHAVMEAGGSEVFGPGWSLKTQGRADAAIWVWRLSGQRIPSSLGNFIFTKAISSLNVAHPGYGDNLLYSKSMDLNVNHIYKLLSQLYLDCCLPNNWVQ